MFHIGVFCIGWTLCCCKG